MNSFVQAVEKGGSAGRRRRRLAMAVPVLVVMALGSVLATHYEPATQLARDAQLCPLDANLVDRRAVYLVDLRKPLDEGAESLPGEILLRASTELGLNDELHVYALTPFSEAPRMSLGKLCKPFANADLTARTAKDQRAAQGDCDDLPAQMSAPLRTEAQRYCELRDGLKERIDELARRTANGAVTDAHLVDAFTEIDRNLHGQGDEAKSQATLYVFSDMMQHADWYSHLAEAPGASGEKIEENVWRFADFQARSERRRASFGLASPPSANLAVRVFYVPRQDMTDERGRRHAHKQFWRDYFGQRQVVFLDQSTMSKYAWSWAAG